jgi:hypothetical protein
MALPAGLGLLTLTWLAVLPREFDLAPLSANDWGIVVSGLAVGAIVASLIPSPQIRPPAERLASRAFDSSASPQEIS